MYNTIKDMLFYADGSWDFPFNDNLNNYTRMDNNDFKLLMKIARRIVDYLNDNNYDVHDYTVELFDNLYYNLNNLFDARMDEIYDTIKGLLFFKNNKWNFPFDDNLRKMMKVSDSEFKLLFKIARRIVNYLNDNNYDIENYTVELFDNLYYKYLNDFNEI